MGEKEHPSWLVELFGYLSHLVRIADWLTKECSTLRGNQKRVMWMILQMMFHQPWMESFYLQMWSWESRVLNKWKNCAVQTCEVGLVLSFLRIRDSDENSCVYLFTGRRNSGFSQRTTDTDDCKRGLVGWQQDSKNNRRRLWCVQDCIRRGIQEVKQQRIEMYFAFNS